MKNLSKFLLAGGAAVALAGQAGAADPLLSPRAQANQTITVSGGGADPDLVHGQNLVGAAAAAKAAGTAVVAGSSKNDPDLVHGQWARTGSPKGLQQLRESGREFQVAPLK